MRAFEQLLEAIPVPAAVSSLRDGRLLWVNEAAARFSGTTIAELIGRPAVTRWADAAERARFVEVLQGEGVVREMAVTVLGPDERPRRVLMSGVKAEFRGEPALFVTLSDVTQLEESERRYRMLAEHVHDVIWTLDLATFRFTYVSPSITALRGLTVEEALDEPIERSLTPESLARVQAQMADLGQPGSVGMPGGPPAWTDVYDQPCKDGTVKHVEITTTVLLDAEGRPTTVLGVSRDVTARVEAERARAAAEAQVMRLEGLIPICAHCKSIRDDQGYWKAVERYVSERSAATFSHGICPACLEKHFG